MTDGLEPIKDLLGNYRIAEKYRPDGRKIAGGERGQLIGYFIRKTGWTAKGVANAVGHLKDLRDLYYIKSDCDQAEARGVPWRAAFRTALGMRKKDRM